MGAFAFDRPRGWTALQTQAAAYEERDLQELLNVFAVPEVRAGIRFALAR